MEVLEKHTIKHNQLQTIQIECKNLRLDREERLQFLSDHFGREILTTKDLTTQEADDLIYFFKTGHRTQNNWGLFDKNKFPKERSRLFSYMYQAQWVVANQSSRWMEVPDLERLSNFLKSPKSPVNKPVKKFTKTDWNKINHAFRNIAKGLYK